MQRNYLENKYTKQQLSRYLTTSHLMLNLVDGQITGSGLFSKQAQGHEFEGPPKKQGQS